MLEFAGCQVVGNPSITQFKLREVSTITHFPAEHRKKGRIMDTKCVRRGILENTPKNHKPEQTKLKENKHATKIWYSFYLPNGKVISINFGFKKEQVPDKVKS